MKKSSHIREVQVLINNLNFKIPLLRLSFNNTVNKCHFLFIQVKKVQGQLIIAIFRDNFQLLLYLVANKMLPKEINIKDQ